jgi:hypothetical protein
VTYGDPPDPPATARLLEVLTEAATEPDAAWPGVTWKDAAPARPAAAPA